MAETGWTKRTPALDGMYWWRADERDYEPEMHEIADGKVYRMESRRSESADNYGGEWLGPISPSDTEQLAELQREALKGICVYCGEIQEYESLEQKSGKEGNRIRVEHIKQCPQRPELKLITYCEELQVVANAALRWLEGGGEVDTIDHIKDRLRAALNPSRLQEGKETR